MIFLIELALDVKRRGGRWWRSRQSCFRLLTHKYIFAFLEMSLHSVQYNYN
jgi:hypothetical protein